VANRIVTELFHITTVNMHGEIPEPNEGTPVTVGNVFDSANIEVVDASDPGNVQLKIRPDPFCKGDDIAHFQWFHFRLSGVRNMDVRVHLVNAGQSSFPEAWPGYKGCASYDLCEWFRVETIWDEKQGVISMSLNPDMDSVYFAYFPPYQYNKHQELVARTQCKDSVCLHILGKSLDGRDLDLLQIGAMRKDKLKVWMIARQHPGESMAEWFMDGFLERLTDEHDAASMRVMRQAVFYVMPNSNPDGSIRGHLRTNAKGANLNREWANPTKDYSPEVYYLRQKMDEVGVDLFLDIHGDEEIPFNFLAGSEGIPSFGDRLRELQDAFCSAFVRASPDFQPKPGYEVDKPGQANLAIASNAVAERYKCLSYTLEMPFKDTEDSPDSVHGWSPHRARKFGAAILQPIYEVLPMLKKHLPEHGTRFSKQ
jgi:murein tripeptide amidase MpaA